ncbi:MULTISPECIES: enoyl-CoA hydratase/isomerase family protein [unclassified Beijerinckia]|uniref:enoyl-CoA hydratase/isomerase family protein n=1 Tax=unclassified Beijerinckia TaxID=2638183 RepID=UPI00089C44ED|nr:MULTISPECIES: enoyl-CoA hydratase/isomerase family protein [unclassified Beijerinckia]MDH7796904.1 enoyl-CoA hydratase [Beijerinckia sp. GAS462]SEC64587.1 enoyl-CoA hydratase [Beijerinckia sp. 28-YEA-48]
MNDIVVARQGNIGRLTLNRPKALNALSRDMVRVMGDALETWRNDPAVVAVLVDGAGERGLCAGGDIRLIYDEARAGRYIADDFWREEYIVNAAISAFPKPYIALMDGIVMGGGVGISAHGSHRIVTDRTRLAMPEVAIGFSPDVGGSYLLARAPGELGTWAGLTAIPMSGADALVCGMADYYCPSAALPGLIEALAQVKNAAEVEAAIRSVATEPPVSALATHRAAIDAGFSKKTIEEILVALDGAGNDFLAEAANRMRRHSPTSLKVTLRALREARAANDLKASLRMEYRIATACIRRHDMIEGIRAVVVDKDQKPSWQPDTLAGVSAADVAAFFAPPVAGDMVFNS